jgi:hypothetical protein
MDFDTSTSKLTGTPGESGWAQVHEFRPEEIEKFQKRGTLFAVFATNKKGEGLQEVVLGREIVGRLHEEYFGNLETSAFNAIKNAVSKVCDEFSDATGRVEIAACALVSGVLYCAACAGAKVMIYRHGVLTEILDTKDSTMSASGYPKNEDVVICTTANFLSTVSMGAIKAAVSGKDVQKAAEQLAPSVHSSEYQGKLGAIFVKFSDKGDGSKKINEFGQKNYQPLISEKIEKAETEVLEENQKSGAKLDVLKNFFRKNAVDKLYVRSKTRNLEEAQGKKTAISVGVLILALLVISIFFGIKQKNAKEKRQEYETVLTEATHQFDEANEIYSLNPQRARELFSQSKEKVSGLLEQGIENDELNSLWSKIEENEGVILGEYSIEPDLFMDLTLQSNDFSGTDMALSDDTLFVLDDNAEKAISVVVGTKNTRVLAGPSLIENAKYIASYSDRAFILSIDKVYEVGDEKRDLIEKDWEGEALPYAYTGNFYILDKGSSQIFRYAGTGASFSPKTNWLAEKVETDFSNVVSWSIDGNIWMLESNGNILRFSLGNKITFSPKGLSPQLTQPEQIYTNDETDYLYILDPENKRVVVLSKEGDFKAQYVSDKIKEAIDLGVSEMQKKMILLTPGKLLSIELKHL